ncbi:MAG: toll/interleukin-1 receptor domain-containing protein [Pseudomonadota bacterium]
MAFIPGCKNDLFISYAHADNIRGSDDHGVVETFVQRLREMLNQRLSQQGVEVFWDQTHLRANQVLDQALTEEVGGSALFLGLASPAFVNSQYTQLELDCFRRHNPSSNQQFFVELLPLEETGQARFGLSEHLRFEFWRRSGPTGQTPMMLDIKTDWELYMTNITQLANQLRDALVDIRNARSSGGTRTRPIAPSARLDPEIDETQSSDRGTVLLAQSTEDVDFEREQVRAALMQLGIKVVPEFHYPQGGEEFRAAFEKDLQDADLFVQLLGRTAGRQPPDMPDGYPMYQADAAQAAGVERLGWRHQEIDLEQIPQEHHQSLLSAEHVIASGLEAFKSEIVERLEKIKKPAPEKLSTSHYFIGADASDEHIASELLQAFGARKRFAAIPCFDDDPHERDEDIWFNLTESDAVLMMQGNAPVSWVRSFLNRLRRAIALRETPPEFTVLVKAPPKGGASINQSFPSLEVIDCTDGFDIDRIFHVLEPRL